MRAAMKKSVSEKNTKNEILEAYQELAQKLETDGATVAVVEKVKKANRAVTANLQTLVDTTSQTLSEVVAELTQQLDNAMEAVEELRTASTSHRAQLIREREDEKLRRVREEEEYQYTFNKKRGRQEEELAEGRRRQETELKARRDELAAQQEELLDLRTQVKTFETRMAKAVSDAVAQTTKQLNIESNHAKALAQAHYTSTQTLLTQKVQSLEELCQSQTRETERLNKALVDASAQITRIAERAVTRDSAPTAPSSS